MKRKIFILLMLFFIQGVVTNIHHPLTPYYVEYLGLSGFMVGLYFSCMNLGIMLGGPFWGNLGDHGNKRKAVLIGLTLYAVGQVLFGMGDIFNPWILTFFRLFSGFGIAAATTVIMSEIIVSSETSNERSWNISLAVAILAIGGSIGYFLGGFIHTNKFVISVLGTDKFFNAFMFQGISIMILVFLIFLLFKPEKVEIDHSKKRPQFWDGFKEIKHIGPEMLFFLLALVFITIGASNVDKYLDLYLKDLGQPANFLGNLKMIIGFVSIFVTALLVPFFMKIKKQLTLMAILQALSAVVVFIVFKETNNFILFIYTFFMIYIVAKAIFAPLEQEYVASFSNENNVATMMGIRQSFYSTGSIIGPLLGGWLYSMNYIYVFNSSVIFFLLGIVLLMLSGYFKKRNNQKVNHDI